MKNLLKLIIVLTIFFGALALMTQNYPKPGIFWKKYGFEKGVIIVKIYDVVNPFEDKGIRRDTFKILEVREDFVLLSNSTTVRIHSVGMNLYEWKKVE